MFENCDPFYRLDGNGRPFDRPVFNRVHPAVLRYHATSPRHEFRTLTKQAGRLLAVNGRRMELSGRQTFLLSCSSPTESSRRACFTRGSNPCWGDKKPVLISLELPFLLGYRPSWIRTSHKRVLHSLSSFANLPERQQGGLLCTVELYESHEFTTKSSGHLVCAGFWRLPRADSRPCFSSRTEISSPCENRSCAR